ncbi:MAG: hypothetical protein P8M79_07995 [Alphaproteobacteria bacterium]|nr:hypothetical protein [Alphaproteobacteria bacterium]
MIADKMDEVLADLLVDECEFIEFMVLSRTQTVIAKFDIDVLKRLVSRRLLQLRPGVGTMFMQNYQTSFSIPDAVWNALTTRHQTACDSGGRSVRARIRILKNRLGATLDGIVPIPPSASDT